MKIFKGTLLDHFETGMEGMVWALQQDGINGYEGLVILEAGDYLEIYSPDKVQIFSGTIEPDREAGKQQRPGNGIYQPTALGLWIHWTQRGFEPDVWAELFVSEQYRGVVRRE